jgi:hypothetical protein
MKNQLIALGLATLVTGVATTPSLAQVVIHEDRRSPSVYVEEDGDETQFIQEFNRRHESRDRWSENRRSFGPRDVIRLLERRGYRVRDVNDVGERYLVKASRDGDDLLVSVSRSGEIMGVIHDHY